MEYIAVHPFVKNRRDIMEVRRIMEEFGEPMKVIAKIEPVRRYRISRRSSRSWTEMMIARGDLGVKFPRKTCLCSRSGSSISAAPRKAVIVATQMLDSMIRNPRPTRAEASDVANAVLDGADAVILSGETAERILSASGNTMKRIVARAGVKSSFGSARCTPFPQRWACRTR